MPQSTSTSQLIDGVLRGQRLALARAISRVENGAEDARAILRAIYPHTGGGYVIGVTGAPGTGKSTLVTELVRAYRQAGLTAAVVAVDPTSPFSGGAVLGDRVRMSKLSGDAGVFIRSMATRGSLGGLAAATADVIALLDAAGFQRILVETVGVGQAEVEIASTAHTTVVVEAPGLGDEVQAIKAGILEIADVLVVNKADRPGVERTVTALEMMLHLNGSGPQRMLHHGRLMTVEAPAEPVPDEDVWQVRVLKTVATTGTGVPDLHEEIERHRTWLQESGELAARERSRVMRVVDNLLQAELSRRLRQAVPQEALAALVARVQRREVDPYTAAAEILSQVLDKG